MIKIHKMTKYKNDKIAVYSIGESEVKSNTGQLEQWA